MDEKTLLTVIVTSYTTERLRDIYALLDSIKNQTYPNIETIFVAEKSGELYNRVKAYSEENHIPNTRFIFNNREPGLSAARNLGIKEANGDILAFVDDDVVLPSGWGKAVTNAYKNDSIIGVTGPALPLWADKSMSWLPKELYWLISCTDWCGWNKVTDVRNAWGHNMSFKKEAYEISGLFSNEFGYHKGLIAEDDEFSLRVRLKTRKRIVYDPDVRVWHRVQRCRLGWPFIKERAYWIGRSRRMLKRIYGKKDRDVLSTEHHLLDRILVNLLPQIGQDAFRHPYVAWREFSITFVALFFATMGYLGINVAGFKLR